MLDITVNTYGMNKDARKLGESSNSNVIILTKIGER